MTRLLQRRHVQILEDDRHAGHCADLRDTLPMVPAPMTPTVSIAFMNTFQPDPFRERHPE